MYNLLKLVSLVLTKSGLFEWLWDKSWLRAWRWRAKPSNICILYVNGICNKLFMGVCGSHYTFNSRSLVIVYTITKCSHSFFQGGFKHTRHNVIFYEEIYLTDSTHHNSYNLPCRIITFEVASCIIHCAATPLEECSYSVASIRKYSCVYSPLQLCCGKLQCLNCCLCTNYCNALLQKS